MFVRGTKGNLWPLWQIVGICEFLNAGSANSLLATHLLRSVIYPKTKDRHIVKIQFHLFVAIANLYLAGPTKEFPARDSNNGNDFSSLFLWWIIRARLFPIRSSCYSSRLLPFSVLIKLYRCEPLLQQCSWALRLILPTRTFINCTLLFSCSQKPLSQTVYSC